MSRIRTIHRDYKDYKNNVKKLKEPRNLEVLREFEINEIKEKTKIELNEI